LHTVSYSLAQVGWRSFVILYENEECLVRLQVKGDIWKTSEKRRHLKPFFGEDFADFFQELIKLPKTFTGIHVTLRQLTPDTTDFRPLLKEIKRSGTVSGNSKVQTN
jgi:hypothetical protein